MYMKPNQAKAITSTSLGFNYVQVGGELTINFMISKKSRTGP